MLKVSEFAESDEPMAIAAYRFLATKIFTEESTDFAIDFLLKKVKIKYVPFGRRLAKAFIDPLVPEKILDLIRALMLRTGLATEGDFVRMVSPLRNRGL